MIKCRRIYIFIKAFFFFLIVNHTGLCQTLNVGIVQMDKKPGLDANKNTIIEYIREAKKHACDLVVFPETALGCESCIRDSIYINQLEIAIEEIINEVRKNQIYTIFCVQELRKTNDRFRNKMYAIAEDGKVDKIYDKLWDYNGSPSPGTISIKGIPVGLTICADRWLRSTTDLPLINAPVSVECSWSKLDTIYFPYGPIEGIHWWEIQQPDGTFLDCSPTRGPYWIPRAIRNDAYIICSGRRASIVDPKGRASFCSDKTEQLLARELDLSGLYRENAKTRFNHVAFKPWWDFGTKLLNGEDLENIEPEIYLSDPSEITIALAQISVSNQISENLQQIEQKLAEAKKGNADIVVFPALSITGNPKVKSDIHLSEIEKAIAKISVLARSNNIYVIVGSAWKENSEIYNSAFVIDNKGELITRYDQLSADTSIFSQGTRPLNMWFKIKNVYGVVSVGKDLYWEELAELSACKGAQLLINISNDNFGKYEQYFKQSFATFNTFTVIVNAAENHEMLATGNSRVFNDLRRPKGKYHAEIVLEADGQPGLFFVKETMAAENPWLGKIKRLNKFMIPWYNYGIETICFPNKQSLNKQH